MGPLRLERSRATAEEIPLSSVPGESLPTEVEALRDGQLHYGFVVAVDIEGFSSLHTHAQTITQASLSHVLKMAAFNAQLDRDRWYRQARGDGELAVVPLTADPSWVVARFTEQVAIALAKRRSALTGQPPLRIRMAMHLGSMARGDFGPVGEAPIVASRLLDSRAVRRALASDPAVDLVLVVSEHLYRVVVETRFHGLSPDRFRPVRARIKGITYQGWLCVGSPCSEASAVLPMRGIAAAS